MRFKRSFTEPVPKNREEGFANAAIPAFANPSSRFLGTGSVNDRLKRIHSCQSVCSSSALIPCPFSRRTQSTASAAPTRTFFGSHPRSAHVPPNGLESMTATCHPADRHRDATADAADPVPMTTRSNFLVMLNALFFCRIRKRCFVPRIVHNRDQPAGIGFRGVKLHCCRTSRIPHFGFHNSRHFEQLSLNHARAHRTVHTRDP